MRPNVSWRKPPRAAGPGLRADRGAGPPSSGWTRVCASAAARRLATSRPSRRRSLSRLTCCGCSTPPSVIVAGWCHEPARGLRLLCSRAARGPWIYEHGSAVSRRSGPFVRCRAGAAVPGPSRRPAPSRLRAARCTGPVRAWLARPVAAPRDAGRGRGVSGRCRPRRCSGRSRRPGCRPRPAPRWPRRGPRPRGCRPRAPRCSRSSRRRRCWRP
jgi:hypothetical protein